MLTAWEYAGEIVLAFLISGLLFAAVGGGVMHERLCNLRGDLILIVGVAAGISTTVWAGFLALLSNEFGAWLRKKNEAVWYSRAFATPIFGYLLGLLILLFAGCSQSGLYLRLNVLVLTYDLINCVTMIRNVNGLIALWQTWEQQGKPS
jgi:hypothetical protein